MHFFRLCKNERLLKTFTQKWIKNVGIKLGEGREWIQLEMQTKVNDELL